MTSRGQRPTVPGMNRSLASLTLVALSFFTACEPSFDYGVKKYEVKRLQGILAQQECNKEALVSLLQIMNEAGDTVGSTKVTMAFTAKCGELPWAPWLTHDYGDRLPKVKSLTDALEKEPCDKGRMVKLLDEMVGAGDYRNTLKRADAFFAKCGDLPRARWLTYEAHKRLSEYDAAIAEATKLIESDRYDRDFWWWRGNAQVLKGDHASALADFQEVVKLCPNCTVGWQIADAVEKLGRPCEGIEPLESVAKAHPDASDIDQLRRRIALLREKPECAGIGGTVSTTSVTMPETPAIRDAREGPPGRKR